MRQDLEELLELQRKTKVGEVAPLVDVPAKHFWQLSLKANWAYVHQADIAIAQIELRKRVGFPADQRIANVVALLNQLYEDASWRECGFSHVMAEDSWQMVMLLVDEMSWNDLGTVRLLEKVDQEYGVLAPEEADKLVACKTVGEVAEFWTKIASEGREKALPRKRESSLWRERVLCLFSILYAFGLLWLVGCGIVKLVRWIAA
jgi:hypothetical protein